LICETQEKKKHRDLVKKVDVKGKQRAVDVMEETKTGDADSSSDELGSNRMGDMDVTPKKLHYNMPITNQPNQVQLAMQSQFNSFADVSTPFDEPNDIARTIVLPEYITIGGLTSNGAVHILGAFSSLSKAKREAILSLSQEKLADGLGELVSKKRRVVEHGKSPGRKRFRKGSLSLASSSSISMANTPATDSGDLSAGHYNSVDEDDHMEE
jgi:hypothetical protein